MNAPSYYEAYQAWKFRGRTAIILLLISILNILFLSYNLYNCYKKEQNSKTGIISNFYFNPQEKEEEEEDSYSFGPNDIFTRKI